MPITVAIVEDNPDFRLGTSYVLKSSPECAVVGEYVAAEDLIDGFDEIVPDVVLMDIGLPGISGIEATALLKRQHPSVQIIMLTVYEDDDNVFRAICAGASGYVSKRVPSVKLIEAVEDAFNGGTPISPHVAARVLQMFRDRMPPPTENGMEMAAATFLTTFSTIGRVSWLAVISKNTNSSAPPSS